MTNRNYHLADDQIIKIATSLEITGHSELAENLYKQYIAHIINEESYFGPEDPDVIIEIPLD